MIRDRWLDGAAQIPLLMLSIRYQYKGVHSRHIRRTAHYPGQAVKRMDGRSLKLAPGHMFTAMKKLQKLVQLTKQDILEHNNKTARDPRGSISLPNSRENSVGSGGTYTDGQSSSDLISYLMTF